LQISGLNNIQGQYYRAEDYISG